MTPIVTLEFGDEYLDLECERVEVRSGGHEVPPDRELPEGYIRIEIAESWDWYDGPGPHKLYEGNTALVSDEHVAMIQWED